MTVQISEAAVPQVLSPSQTAQKSSERETSSTRREGVTNSLREGWVYGDIDVMGLGKFGLLIFPIREGV